VSKRYPSPDFRRHGRLWPLLLLLLTLWLPLPGAAQMPLGIIEGRLVAFENSILQVNLASGKQIQCAVDSRTFVDRQRRRLTLNDLKIGDFLELVTERHSPTRPCFARMIHLAEDGLRFAGRDRVGQVTRATETISPRGNVHLAGVVRDVQPHSLELRTKQDGTLRLRLRPDTQFVQDGLPVKREDLPPWLRVSVRCGYALDGELEVYQVVWGGILPRSPLP
jgi:hypothetical protein